MNNVTWLRVAFWWGVIADAIETIRMAVPKLFLASTGIELSPDIGFAFGLLYGVPVMLGWTLILVWADRRPVERKGVLLCLIPVIVAYVVVEIFAISLGIVAPARMMPTFVLQAALLGLCAFSYLASREKLRG